MEPILWEKTIAFPDIHDFRELFDLTEKGAGAYLYGSNFDQHFSSYAKPKPFVASWIEEHMLNDMRMYFQATYRADDDVLISAKYESILGDRWLAIVHVNTIPVPK